jgi:hypothetical protein
MITDTDTATLLSKVRHELKQIRYEKYRAELMAKQKHKSEVAKNMKVDRHSISVFTRQQIRFAEELLGIH